MRITPSRRELEFGERLTWSPPAGAASFGVWLKTSAYTHPEDDAGPATLRAYGGPAPTWVQAAGYDIANDVALDVDGLPIGLVLTTAGLTVEWNNLVALTDGFDPEPIQVVAYDVDVRAISIDRFALPQPSSTAAAVIAAQERRLLQSLLNARERAAAGAGLQRVTGPDGETEEYFDLGVLDRRVADVRARIAWFESAAAGNALPRAEFW